jgi:hypothetical protein
MTIASIVRQWRTTIKTDFHYSHPPADHGRLRKNSADVDVRAGKGTQGISPRQKLSPSMPALREQLLSHRSPNRILAFKEATTIYQLNNIGSIGIHCIDF